MVSPPQPLRGQTVFVGLQLLVTPQASNHGGSKSSWSFSGLRLTCRYLIRSMFSHESKLLFEIRTTGGHAGLLTQHPHEPNPQSAETLNLSGSTPDIHFRSLSKSSSSQ
jgi:hypothetical protein